MLTRKVIEKKELSKEIVRKYPLGVLNDEKYNPLNYICTDNLVQFLGEFTDTGINDIYKSYNASFVESSCGVFDGVDDVVVTSYQISSFTSKMSFGGFFNTKSLISNQTLFGGDDSGQSPILRLRTDGKLQFWSISSGDSLLLDNFITETDTTYKFLLEYNLDAEFISLYIDNTLVFSDAYTGSFGTAGFYQFGAWGSNDFFNGLLFDNRVWQKTLTEEERNQFFNNKSTGNELLHLPFTETYGTTIYDVSGNGNHGTANGMSWGTQDEYHRNITKGFSLYTHITEADIRVPYGDDGQPLTITPPAGYTKESDNLSGNWHNNAETKILQPEETELINADSGIYFWFDGAGNAVAKSYSDLQFDVFNLDPKHKIFADVSIDNKYKNIFTYSVAQSGECLDGAYKLVNDNIVRDASGVPLLDENDEIIRT